MMLDNRINRYNSPAKDRSSFNDTPLSHHSTKHKPQIHPKSKLKPKHKYKDKHTPVDTHRHSRDKSPKSILKNSVAKMKHPSSSPSSMCMQ